MADPHNWTICIHECHQTVRPRKENIRRFASETWNVRVYTCYQARRGRRGPVAPDGLDEGIAEFPTAEMLETQVPR